MDNQDEVDESMTEGEFKSRAIKMNINNTTARKNELLRQCQANSLEGSKRSNEGSTISARIKIQEDLTMRNTSDDVQKNLKEKLNQ